jgi:glycerol kinase
MVASATSAIALDLGTTTIKAGLLNADGGLARVIARAAPAITVSDGRYESDALAYAQVAEGLLAELLTLVEDTPPLGICSQRSSFLIWERVSGQALTPLISWQDTRGDASCDALHSSDDMIHLRTGLHLTPYYFASKLRVLLQERPEWYERLEHGELLVGTLDTFLIWRWTEGKQYVTDASMAARTLLMDVRRQCWSGELCELFSVPLSSLPEIKPSAGMNLPLVQGRVLQASLADQSAAMIASLGEDRSAALVNLGTGGFVSRHLEEGREGHSGYLHTLVYQDRSLRTHFAIEGTLNSIAAALAPYPARECHIPDLAETDIYCLAEPSGIGAPYFSDKVGLMFSEPVDHLAPRQVASLLLEGIIFRVAQILEDFHSMSPIERIYLSGGLSGLACLQQGIARCAPCNVYRLTQRDASLHGAALLASDRVSSLPGRAKQALAEKIIAIQDTNVLTEKYQRWKGWLAKTLSAS